MFWWRLVSCVFVLLSPALPLGDDLHEQLEPVGLVGVAGPEQLPGVAAGVALGCGLLGLRFDGAEDPEHVVAAFAPVLGEGAAGPLAGDQAAAAGVAEVLGAVSFALAQPGHTGVNRLVDCLRFCPRSSVFRSQSRHTCQHYDRSDLRKPRQSVACPTFARRSEGSIPLVFTNT